MNPFELFKNLNLDELKRKSEEAMSKLKEEVVTGEAGGGFVKVTINGEFEILAIDFEENSMVKDDIYMFRDLIMVAYNNAAGEMRNILQTKFSSSLFPGMM